MASKFSQFKGTSGEMEEVKKRVWGRRERWIELILYVVCFLDVNRHPRKGLVLSTQITPKVGRKAFVYNVFIVPFLILT